MKLIPSRGIYLDDGKASDTGLVFVLIKEEGIPCVDILFNEYGHEIKPDDGLIHGAAIEYNALHSPSCVEFEALRLSDNNNLPIKADVSFEDSQSRFSLSVVIIQNGNIASKGYRVSNKATGYTRFYNMLGRPVNISNEFLIYEIRSVENSSILELILEADRFLEELGGHNSGRSKEVQ